MKKYIKPNEWLIIEEGFDFNNQKSSESLFSLGNGAMGQRANFEEKYSGPTLQGNYIAGVYYPDKTRVGWWKNGYPEYFAKVLNAPNFVGINIEIDGEQLDLYTAKKIENFVRVLDMKQGLLTRKFNATLNSGKEISVETERFLSMDNNEVAAIKYSITPINFDAPISFEAYIDGDVKNQDSNYDEKFWNILETNSKENNAVLLSQTKKTAFRVAFSQHIKISDKNAKLISSHNDKIVKNSFEVIAKKGNTITFEKYVGVVSSLNHTFEKLTSVAIEKSQNAINEGYESLLKKHIAKWDFIWKHSDIKIKGDVEAQQGIRYNIFHLNQTYTGEDERLNVGPKGFTGEKYGGTTYWDTEAYCIPFFIATAPQYVTRNLLVYRYKHLQKAIENAQKLGFTDGAALYPMVTINGEECHNEWEITFEEIHRNGAIAHAIFNYIRHTGDYNYLAEYGLEVLIAISRFWAQRATWSNNLNKYVILGVTGPNEYDNNVDNNWYTNKIATWCLNFTLESLERVKEIDENRYNKIISKTSFDSDSEIDKWKDIKANMYFAYNDELDIFMQQDGYMNKEQTLVSELPKEVRPINQHWSWDRILRSPFIKQADTLQGIYLFENEYDLDTIKRHFEFYEPRTVHESSLSPCVHSILASRIGNLPKAYEMYLRTSRLDLDDYNNEVHEGLHITSMAGTWMSIVEGFGGKKIIDNELHLAPIIPTEWESYDFMLTFRGNQLEIEVNHNEVIIKSHADSSSKLFVYEKEITIKPKGEMVLQIKQSEMADA